MRHAIATALFSSVCLTVCAQEQPKYVRDAKFGAGIGYFRASDRTLGWGEMDYTIRVSSLFSVAGGIGFGFTPRNGPIGPAGFTQTTHITTIDGNVFLSPFGNQRKLNLKLGAGPSVLYVADRHRSQTGLKDEYRTNRLTLGANLIAENELTLNRRYLLGVKGVVQPYLNGDLASAVLLKGGIRF